MILDDLRAVIADRNRNPLPGSYVSALIARGKDEILKKVGEEAVEVIVAAKGGDRERILQELADLWFHCMVLMHEEGLSHNDIFAVLEKRLMKRREGNE